MPVWSAEVLEDRHQKFIGRPDESADSFETKLRRQLHDAPPRTLQLMGEILCAHFMLPVDVQGETKRRIINTVLGWSSRLTLALDFPIVEGWLLGLTPRRT